MSRTVRKELFLTLKELKNINSILLNSNSDEKEVFSLLVQCQNYAIELGNTIESVYGQNNSCIHLLEEYCEIIYQISQSISDKAAYMQKCKNALRHIELLIKHMQKEIPDRLEAVFLPYKASMWDSLESVWFAADNDDECDAYVIPIPYYDKNPDGTFREEHYELKEFPEYVSVMQYDKYDFEVRKPDIIFIHNPYDKGNFVTSVHPYFYSKNLKKFTEKLVYIPYFVLDGKGIKAEYVLTTGVLNADCIIVQNEKEKEDYIRHFHDEYPQINIADKILPLGSPKFDKMRSLNRNNVNAPKEWLDRVNGKKVILYNTTIKAMLENTERYVEKMRSVFEFFRQREEAVLLWRPHPLMESTLASMRMDIYERYMNLKNEYMRYEIGIYDDTPDMYMAIGLSDAYYGDWSSVVWLYKQTGKMVLIQEIESE